MCHTEHALNCRTRYLYEMSSCESQRALISNKLPTSVSSVSKDSFDTAFKYLTSHRFTVCSVPNRGQAFSIHVQRTQTGCPSQFQFPRDFFRNIKFQASNTHHYEEQLKSEPPGFTGDSYAGANPSLMLVRRRPLHRGLSQDTTRLPKTKHVTGRREQRISRALHYTALNPEYIWYDCSKAVLYEEMATIEVRRCAPVDFQETAIEMWAHSIKGFEIYTFKPQEGLELASASDEK